MLDGVALFCSKCLKRSILLKVGKGPSHLDTWVDRMMFLTPMSLIYNHKWYLVKFLM